MKITFRSKKGAAASLSILWTTVATLILCLMLGRGVFELFMQKNMAYVASVVPFCIGVACLCFSKPKLEPKWRNVSISLFAILLTAVASAAMTAGLLLNSSALPYLPFYLATPIFMCWGLIVRGDAERRINWPVVVALGGWFLTIVAALDMIRILEMPGGWFAGGLVRPAGPTGSKQHYSIVQAIVAVMCLQFYVWRKARFQLVSFIVFSLMVFLSQGRSGILILMVGCAGTVFAMRRKSDISRLVIALLLIGTVLVGMLVFTPVGEVVGRRVAGMFDTEEGANYKRLEMIQANLNKWSDTNLLIGEWFGSHTQVNTNIRGAQSAGITESSVVMTLLHAGILGLIAYYTPFAFLFSYVRRGSRILASLIIGCFLQSFVYMSLEAVPFIAMLGLLPVIYRNVVPPGLRQVSLAGARKEQKGRRAEIGQVLKS